MPYGVTEELLETYGQIIFDLSLNKQVRKGDPVRALDVEAWKAQRDATGLSDTEIAARVGLAVPQVTFIRNVIERRLFRTDQYRKLFRLGGGKRYNPDTWQDPEAELAYEEAALKLRKKLKFDPERVAEYFQSGIWTADTLTDYLSKNAAEVPDDTAINEDDRAISWKSLGGLVDGACAALASTGVRRGDVVGLRCKPSPASVIGVLAIWKLGVSAVAVDEKKSGHFSDMPIRAELADELTGEIDIDVRELTDKSSGSETDGTFPNASVAADPAWIERPADAAGIEPLIFTHQAIAAAGRAVLGWLDDWERVDFGGWVYGEEPLSVTLPDSFHARSMASALAAWLQCPAELRFDDISDIEPEFQINRTEGNERIPVLSYLDGFDDPDSNRKPEIGICGLPEMPACFIRHADDPANLWHLTRGTQITYMPLDDGTIDGGIEIRSPSAAGHTGWVDLPSYIRDREEGGLIVTKP